VHAVHASLRQTLKLDHRTYTCTSTRKRMSGCESAMVFIFIYIEGNYLE